MSKRKFQAGFTAVEMIFVMVFLAIILAIASGTMAWWTHATERVTVTGIIVKNYHHESKYLVFTSDGVFENTDTWWYMKFNSSDIQGQLMQGGTFDISYYGWRIPFFSKYPNITYVHRVQ